MWTLLYKKNLENFLNQYPQLGENFEFLKLLETSDSIFFPRLFIHNYPSEYLIKYLGKKESIPEEINISFNKPLRPKQERATTEILKIFKTQGYVNGICKMPPGFGKTVLSVYLASKIGLKTCIIVDNDVLMKQWLAAFLNFSNLTVDDIGIIKQNIKTTDKPIIIAMAQSLLSKIKKDFNKAFEWIDDSKFGLVIYDEVHCTSSSEKFSKISLLFRTRNVLGLSATPFQNGVAEVLMHNTIGDVIFETNEYDLTPKYYFVYYNSGIASQSSGWKRKSDKSDILVSQRMGMNRDYIKKKAYYNSVIVNSNIYLSIISSYTKTLVDKGHKIIIMCMTKKQVQIISEKLTNDGIVNRRFTGEETEIDKDNDSVLVVTYSYCNKGFDMPSLSVLMYACPLAGKKSVIQTMGRVLRGKEGKNDPIVIDLIDEAFPLLFLPEVKMKRTIIQNEFENCQIVEHKEKRDFR